MSRSWIVLVGCALASSCGDREGAPTGREPEAPSVDPALAEPDDVMGRQLRRMAGTSGGAPGHLPVGVYFRGSIERGEQRDFLAVLKAGHCYRFVGIGDPEVEDLDLVLYDPNGVQMQEDLDPMHDFVGRPTVIGQDAAICPPEAGQYRLQVRMAAGRGAFLVGVYRTP
jgi:hypothetical protein